jgi:hypothetical protein
VSYEAGTIVPVANFWVPKTTATTLSARINANIGGAGLENWVFVENIPAGTGAGQSGSANVTFDVYKCKGTGTSANSAGVDFYFALGGNTSGTNGVASGFIIAEDYKSIADFPADADRAKFRRGCPVPVTGTTPDATNFTFSETYQVATSISKVDYTPTMTNAAGGAAYWMKIDHNFIIITTKIGTSFASYFGGVFDSLISGTDTEVMPLCAITSSSGSFSRLPGVTASAGGATMWGTTATSWNFPTHNTTETYTTLNRWVGSGKMLVQRIALAHAASAAQTYGSLRGLMKPEILGLSSYTGITPSPGDTIVIDGNTWTCISPSSALNGVTGTLGYTVSTNAYFVRAT